MDKKQVRNNLTMTIYFETASKISKNFADLVKQNKNTPICQLLLHAAIPILII